VPESSPLTVVSLMPHAAAGPGPVGSVAVAVRWREASGMLFLEYRIDADPVALRLPAPAVPRRADGLWRHTCLEAFVRAAGHRGYLEFNFSPSGEWAAYRFDARREGMQPLELPREPETHLQARPHGLRLHVALQLPGAHRGTIELGLAAIVEAADGTLGYWALRHGSGAPDFHDPESFTLRPGTDATGTPP
jgi:hypothetical protein